MNSWLSQQFKSEKHSTVYKSLVHYYLLHISRESMIYTGQVARQPLHFTKRKLDFIGWVTQNWNRFSAPSPCSFLCTPGCKHDTSPNSAALFRGAEEQLWLKIIYLRYPSRSQHNTQNPHRNRRKPAQLQGSCYLSLLPLMCPSLSLSLPLLPSLFSFLLSTLPPIFSSLSSSFFLFPFIPLFLSFSLFLPHFFPSLSYSPSTFLSLPSAFPPSLLHASSTLSPSLICLIHPHCINGNHSPVVLVT